MRTWLITGASRGFGTLIAERALRAGDAVIATARKPQDITDRLGEHPNLLALRLDVTREDEAHQAVAEGIKRFGRIDVLINNAGFGVLGAVEETSASETERLFATNVFGLLNVTRAVLPHMRARRRGRIINISSIGGYQAYMGWGVYGSTKFAVEGISEALHQELAPLGIQVTVVEPGFFRTDFLDEQSLEVCRSHAGAGQCAEPAATVGAGQRHHCANRGEEPPGGAGVGAVECAGTVHGFQGLTQPPLKPSQAAFC